MAIWAKGIDFKNTTNTVRLGGVGLYGTDNTSEKIYLGFDSEPWNNSGLQITRTELNYKGNKIYHEGDKPTPADIGAATASHNHNYLPLSGGTLTGKLTASDYISLGAGEQNSFSKNGLMLYEGNGGIKYGITLWNTNGTSGQWSTMIFGPNQSNRRISFGKVNSDTPTNNSHITEGAYFNLDNWDLVVNGDIYAKGSNKVYHTGNKPTASDIGAAESSHTHSDNGFMVFRGGASNFDTRTGIGIFNYATSETGRPNDYGSVLQWANRSDAIPGGDQHWITQLASGTNNNLYYRTRTNGGSWNAWSTIWHSGNFDPNSKANSSHSHSYLPLSGGTLSGDLYVNTGKVPAFATRLSTSSMYTNKITVTGDYAAWYNQNAYTGVDIDQNGIVAPTVYANDWFRSNGNTGWYNQTYGGGWYMIDTTWIRAYNNKNIYTAGAVRASELRADNRLYFTGGETGYYANAEWSDNRPCIRMPNVITGKVISQGGIMISGDNVWTEASTAGVWGFEPNRQDVGRVRLANSSNHGSIRIEGWNPWGTFVVDYVFTNGGFYPGGGVGNPTLGLSSGYYRWGQVYSTSGSISTSDSKLKENIKRVVQNKKIALMAKEPVEPEATGEDMWDYVKQTSTYTYNYKAKYAALGIPQKEWLGVLADEIPTNIFEKIGMISKTQEEYEKELEEQERLKQILMEDLSRKTFELNDEKEYDIEREYGNEIIEGTGLTRREIKRKVDEVIEEPVRMINSSAQIAMLQEVLSMAINRIELLEEQLMNLTKDN